MLIPQTLMPPGDLSYPECEAAARSIIEWWQGGHLTTGGTVEEWWAAARTGHTGAEVRFMWNWNSRLLFNSARDWYNVKQFLYHLGYEFEEEGGRYTLHLSMTKDVSVDGAK